MAKRHSWGKCNSAAEIRENSRFWVGIPVLFTLERAPSSRGVLCDTSDAL